MFFYELDNTIGAEMRCLMQWSACSFMRCKDALVASCMYIIMLQCYAVVSVMLCWDTMYYLLFSVMFCCVMRWSVLCSGVLCAGQCIPWPLPSRYRPLKASHCAPLDCTAPGWTSMPPCALCFAVCGHNSSVRLVLCLAGLAVGVQCAVIFAQCPVWCRILYLVFSAVLSV